MSLHSAIKYLESPLGENESTRTMNTFLPANMLTNKDKVISLRDDTVKVSDENADRTTMVRPPSSSYSARVKVHIKPLGIKFVEKIDSSACPTIRDFVERQLWKVQEIRGKEIKIYVEEEGNEEEGYELFGDTETCVLKPDELLTVKLVSDDTKKQKKAKTVERTRKTKKVTSTTRMVDFYEEGKKKRKKGEEESAEKDSSSEDEDGENESILKHQIVHSAIVRAGAKGIHAKDLSEREKVKLNTVRAVQLKGMQEGIYKRVSPGTYAITSKGSEKVIKKMKNSPNSVLTISTPTNAKNFTTIKSPLTTQRKLLTTDDISSRLTGKMISVKFEDPPEWFVATVLSFDVIEQKSSLFYQDGDRELLNMAKACRKGQLSWVVHGDNGTSKTHYRLPPPSPITDSEKAQRALERLRSYIKSLNGTLPEGWNDVDIHYYRNGVSENYFISPEGRKYKGPRAVAKALNLL